jgi:DNA-binding transcriptional MocR family regulator
VLPTELAAATEAAAVSTYISPPFLSQATVYEFIRRGRFEPNLERVRGLLKARRDAMLEALEREFPAGARWSRPEGGYFLWLELPNGARTADLLQPAADAGVAFVKGADFFPAGSGAGENALRLAYSFVSPAEIGVGIARLAPLVGAASPAGAAL